MSHDNDIELIENVDWEGIRPIYRKLSDEFHVLLSSFDVNITDKTKIHLDHLICCIDEVDKVLDDIPDQNLREELSREMISLIDGTSLHLAESLNFPSLEKRLLMLKKIADDLNISARIIKAAKIIFSRTEEKRHVKKLDDFIPLVMEEGAATAELPLSILGAESNHKFDSFFENLCSLMGIADLVVDARDDFKQGIIAMKPSLGIYPRLIWITIVRGLKLLFSIPNKVRFLLYCYRLTKSLLKGN